MFVYSVKSSKIKGIAIVLVVALALGAVYYFLTGEEPAANDGGISMKASNAGERVAFLSQFGWEINEDPLEVAEVIIPAEFDNAYESYNNIQKKQDMDLEAYKGKRAKRWTYEVSNYPGYEQKGGLIQANLLIYEGMVIGGDICSVELNGFMQGFDFPAANNATTTKGGTGASVTAKQ